MKKALPLIAGLMFAIASTFGSGFYYGFMWGRIEREPREPTADMSVIREAVEMQIKDDCINEQITHAIDRIAYLEGRLGMACPPSLLRKSNREPCRSMYGEPDQ